MAAETSGERAIGFRSPADLPGTADRESRQPEGRDARITPLPHRRVMHTSAPAIQQEPEGRTRTTARSGVRGARSPRRPFPTRPNVGIARSRTRMKEGAATGAAAARRSSRGGRERERSAREQAALNNELPTRLVGLEQGTDRFREADGPSRRSLVARRRPALSPSGIDEVAGRAGSLRFQARSARLTCFLPVGERAAGARESQETRDAPTRLAVRRRSALASRAPEKSSSFRRTGTRDHRPQARAGRRRRKRRDRFAR